MKIKVAVVGTVGKTVVLDTSPPKIGDTLLMPDGSVATLEKLKAALGISSTSAPTAAHRLLAGLSVGDDHPQYLRRDILTTAGDMMYEGATEAVRLALGTSGYWLKAGASAPAWQAPGELTKTDDTNVTLTLGGSPTTALLNAASITVGWSGTLAVTRGGTAIGSYTAGDLLYASGATALSKLGIGSTGDVLTVVGGAPAWAPPATSGYDPTSSGTYTPTITNNSNVASSTAHTWFWTRIGNIVHVAGQVDITPSSAATTSWLATLPVASSIANTYEAAGTIASRNAIGENGYVCGNSSNVQMGFVPINTGARNMMVHFSYQVI